MAYEVIDVRTEAEKVGIITLNRPKQLNALNDALMDELGAAVKAFDTDEAIAKRCGLHGPALAFAERLEAAAIEQLEGPELGVVVHPSAWLAHRHLDRARQVRAHRHRRAGLGPLVGGGDVVKLRAARVRAAAAVDLCQSAEVLDFLAQRMPAVLRGV